MNGFSTEFDQTIAGSVNSNGIAVGISYDDTFTLGRATLFRNGQSIDLNTLATLPDGWLLRYAYDVNDAGQIVGRALDADGGQHAFLLTPNVPEPATLGAVAGAASTLLVRRRRRASGPR